MTRRSLSLLAGLILGTVFAGAAAADESPFFSPFPGSKLEDQKVKEFDEYEFPEGAIARGRLVKSETLEGKFTTLKYNNPANRSTLELMRNYRSSLEKSGFKVLYSCSAQECGDGCMTDKGLDWRCTREEHRYLAAKLPRPEGDVYAAVYVDDERTHVAIVERKGMEDHSTAGSAPDADSAAPTAPAARPAMSLGGTKEVTTGVIKGLSQFGFQAKVGSAEGASADILVEGTVETLPLEAGGDQRWKWARSNVTMNLRDGHSGKTFLSFNATDREAASGYPEAARRSRVELAKKVSDQVQKAITDYFENQ